MKKYSRFSGFTLIELMIAVAIIGILAAIAYPSYLQSVRKSNRVEAKVEVMDAAQRLQRCYTAFGVFNHAQCTIYTQISGANTVYSRGQQYYKITFAASPAVSATTYTLVATADKEPQLKDKKGTDCTVLKLDQDGLKTPADCW